MRTISILFFLFILPLSFAQASSYSEFAEQVKYQTQTTQKEGLSYMLSGGLALVGGGIGWSRSHESVEKGFYSLAQSLGLLAIGYGAEAYYLKQDDEMFLNVLNSGDLNLAQKNKMVESYLAEKKEKEESLFWIQRTTFGLAGLLNVIYASQAKDQTLQNFLYVTAGVQLVWAFTF